VGQWHAANASAAVDARLISRKTVRVTERILLQHFFLIAERRTFLAGGIAEFRNSIALCFRLTCPLIAS
jgi:hypothetical protein